MNRTTRLAAGLIFGLAALGAHADPVQQAQVLLERALGEIHAQGMQTAALQFQRESRWSDGAALLMVADFEGHVVAHSANQRLTGSNMLQARDAAGRPFMQQAIAAARTLGRGEIAVRWGHPKTRRLADGTLVVRRVPGQDLCVASLVFP